MLTEREIRLHTSAGLWCRFSDDKAWAADGNGRLSLSSETDGRHETERGGGAIDGGGGGQITCGRWSGSPAALTQGQCGPLAPPHQSPPGTYHRTGTARTTIGQSDNSRQVS